MSLVTDSGDGKHQDNPQNECRKVHGIRRSAVVLGDFRYQVGGADIEKVAGCEGKQAGHTPASAPDQGKGGTVGSVPSGSASG